MTDEDLDWLEARARSGHQTSFGDFDRLIKEVRRLRKVIAERDKLRAEVERLRARGDSFAEACRSLTKDNTILKSELSRVVIATDNAGGE